MARFIYWKPKAKKGEYFLGLPRIIGDSGHIYDFHCFFTIYICHEQTPRIHSSNIYEFIQHVILAMRMSWFIFLYLLMLTHMPWWSSPDECGMVIPTIMWHCNPPPKILPSHGPLGGVHFNGRWVDGSGTMTSAGQQTLVRIGYGDIMGRSWLMRYFVEIHHHHWCVKYHR